MANGLESVLPPPSSLSELTRPQAVQLTAMFATLAVLLPFMLQIYHEYLAFVALGPGGTPANIAGFVRIKVLGLFALRDPCRVVATPKHLRGVPGFLTHIPSRQGPRPATRGIAPHRQVTQRASRETFEKLASSIKLMAFSSDTLVLGTSCFVSSAFHLRAVRLRADDTNLKCSTGKAWHRSVLDVPGQPNMSGRDLTRATLRRVNAPDAASGGCELGA
nr:hypothetical protein CFP56_01206 [Quercus suber]